MPVGKKSAKVESSSSRAGAGPSSSAYSGQSSSSASSSSAAAVDRDKTPPRRFPGPTISVPPRNANNNYQNLQDPPTPSGKVNERIRNLRQKCMEALGREAFLDAYQFLKEFEEVFRV
jgi:hypothetical protein